MRKWIINGLFLMVLSPAVMAQGGDKSAQAGPAITFEENTYDFGEIRQGEKVEHIFAFENTGTEPLIISNVQVTCGCTAPQWPRDPILPGTRSELKVIFNSSGKMGKQHKPITVISNATNSTEKVYLTGTVLAKEKKKPNR